MNDVPPITVTSIDFEKIDQLLNSERYKRMAGADALRYELDRANIIEPNEVPPGLVTMNSTVLFRDESTKSEYELTLVYPDSQDMPNPVSIFAPVGSALLGMSVGQKISWQVPGGRTLQLHVLEVRHPQ